MCFVLSFGNLVLLSCFKSLINMKNSHPRHTESHSEGKWNKPLEKEHTEAVARHCYSNNSFDLFGIILHGLALIAGHSLQHLNAILERASDNHLVRTPRLLLLLLIIAFAANVAVFARYTGDEKQQEKEVCRSQLFLSERVPWMSLQCAKKLLFGSQVHC